MIFCQLTEPRNGDRHVAAGYFIQEEADQLREDHRDSGLDQGQQLVTQGLAKVGTTIPDANC